MNSANESLYFGVPLVVYLQQAEQMSVSRRIAELGAGICPGEGAVRPKRLLAAVRKVVSEERYRYNAQMVGESLRAGGGFKRAAEIISGFIQSRSHSDGPALLEG